MSVTKIKTGSGFVLIEALVASSILSVVLAAGIGAFLLSVRTSPPRSALDDVYRHGGEDITESGTLDPDTKKVTVSVSWRAQSGTSTRSLSIYMTNMFNN